MAAIGFSVAVPAGSADEARELMTSALAIVGSPGKVLWVGDEGDHFEVVIDVNPVPRPEREVVFLAPWDMAERVYDAAVMRRVGEEFS